MSTVLSHNSPLNYRPDIDGLRAVAVLSVIAGHLQIARMHGGFVGVDVFFVISGYLISSIIFSEIAASRFSILAFYERRIRRIFPALFCMLLVFSVLAIVYFLPVEFVGYCKSLLAATASSSNFYFWQHSGYFDSPTSNPLLHTWSLAVEEQFYILFPLFLLVVRKFSPRRLRVSVVGLFIASLLISAVVVHYARSTAFYMPYTRAWELLLGTMLSLKMFPRPESLWLRNLATLAGAVMIVYSVVTYSSSTPFPGLSALLPCIGSALIIGSGESGSSVVSSLLSLRPVVFVGLISYSLYLWHWPVIILFKMGILFPIASTLSPRYIGQISVFRYNVIVQSLVSVCLAILSWRFVERPFRKGSLRLNGKPLFALAGGVMLVFAVFSCSVMAARGFTGRFSANSIQLASYLDNSDSIKSWRVGSCFITGADRFEDFNPGLCLRPKADQDNYLLLGDSHSVMLLPGITGTVPEVHILQASTNGCGPFVHPTGSPDCIKMMKYIYQDYLPSHPVRGLLLGKRWTKEDFGRLGETLEWVRAHKIPVILFGPVPEYDAPLPRLEAYSIAWNQPNLVSQHRFAGTDTLDSQLQHIAASWNVPYMSLYQTICEQGKCAEYADAQRTVPLMFDADHLSPSGSLMVIQRLIDRGELSLSKTSQAM